MKTVTAILILTLLGFSPCGAADSADRDGTENQRPVRVLVLPGERRR